MKKRFIVLSMLIALVFCFNQNGFAASAITLNLNATGLTTVNKLYTVTNNKIVETSLGWTEKVLYNMNGAVSSSVTNTVDGHIIVRVDILSTSSDDGTVSFGSYWLKQGKINSPFGAPMKSLQLVRANETAFDYTTSPSAIAYGSTVDPTELSSLLLNEDEAITTYIPAGSTTQLIGFPASSVQFPAQITFTAILVDKLSIATDGVFSATATMGQIIGVDIKTMYFNWVGGPTQIKAGIALSGNRGETEDPILPKDLGGILWALGGYAMYPE